MHLRVLDLGKISFRSIGELENQKYAFFRVLYGILSKEGIPNQ
jgi:hypothetical protein